MLDPQLLAPDGVVYDDDAHSYTLDGVRVPSVSQICSVVKPDEYAMVSADVLARASARGRACHAMCALDVRDQLDVSSLGEELLFYYSQWDEFRANFIVDVHHSERVVCSRKFMYCGTLDLIATLRLRGKKIRALIDLKFTAAMPALVKVQTAGYKVAAIESLGEKLDLARFCLWFPRTGGYRLAEHKEERADTTVFQSARTIIHWRDSHG